MKKICVLLLALACMVVFAGCSCEHEWADADCTTPYTCTECGETVGSALGHVWTEATCTTAKTCSRCGQTEGEPLGHAWTDATCTAAQICATCGETVGEALGHTWVEATTEAPKTCTACGAAEGEKIAVADSRFVIANAEPFFGRWESEINYTGEDLGIEDFKGALKGIYVMEFGETGEVTCSFELESETAFRDAMNEYTQTWINAGLEEKEVDKETADAVAYVLFGMSLDEYAKSNAAEKDINELVEELLYDSNMGSGWAGTFCYYVDGDRLYWDDDWKDDMYYSEFEFLGTTLVLDDIGELKAVDLA